MALHTLVPRPRLIDRLALVLFVTLCAVTNPDERSHVEALRRAGYRERVEPPPIFDDCLLASTTTTHIGLTLGVLGQVFAVDRRPAPGSGAR